MFPCFYVRPSHGPAGFACPPQVLMNPRDAQGREITWRSSAALDSYVRRLSAVSGRLAQRNRTLRQWHATLVDKVHAARVGAAGMPQEGLGFRKEGGVGLSLDWPRSSWHECGFVARVLNEQLYASFIFSKHPPVHWSIQSCSSALHQPGLEAVCTPDIHTLGGGQMASRWARGASLSARAPCLHCLPWRGAAASLLARNLRGTTSEMAVPQQARVGRTSGIRFFWLLKQGACPEQFGQGALRAA
jgi:hypothetical protein